MGALPPHIWQGTPAYSISQEDSKDEEGKEEAHHKEEETPTNLDGS